jgi:hypothetical protein
VGNPNNGGNLGFQSLLYYAFIVKARHRVVDVAVKLKIAEDTLYKYIEGRNVMPPDRIVDLIRVTGDLEFLEFFCKPCGYMAVKAPQGKLFDQPHEKDEILLSILNGQALEEIEKAHEDGRIDKQEFQKIQKRLTHLQQKAAEIGEKIRAEIKA